MRQITRTSASPRWKYWLVGACSLLPLLLSACETGAQNSAKLDPNQVFIFPNTRFAFAGPSWQDRPQDESDFIHLDPAYAQYVYELQVLTMIQRQLYTFDSNMNIIPDAAKDKPEISPDGKTYTIALRDGLEWSDGTPLTSQDYKLGIMHNIDPHLCDNPNGPLNDPAALSSCAYDPVNGNSQFNLGFLTTIAGVTDYASGKAQDVSGIETPDAKTIVFHLIAPASYFIGQLTTAVGMPLETKVYNQYHYDFISHFTDGVGQSGPFMIKSFSDPKNPQVKDAGHATQIDFVPNPHWNGKPLTLKEVDMPLIADKNDMYQQYVNNAADYSLVPDHEYPFTQNLPDFHGIPSLNIDYFALNRLDPPFDNVQVRQAFDLALNKQLLVDTIFQGARTPSNHIIPFGIPGYNPNLLNPPDNSASAALTGNQQQAKDLITSVAKNCLTDFKDWCPYLIGSKGVGKSDAKTLYKDSNSCPNMQISVDSNGHSTQKVITVAAPNGNQDRIKFTQAAGQVWSNVLCLNVVTETSSADVGDAIGAQTSGQPTKIQAWTLGYAADYPDAQDFTGLQFEPASASDSSRVGYPAGADAQIVQQMQAADIELDRTKRIQLYQQLEQSLVNDVAWIPYDQQKLIYRLKPYVHGFVIPADLIIPDLSWSDVFIEAHS